MDIFSKKQKKTQNFVELIKIFEKNASEISSKNHHLKSDDVLRVVSNDLLNKGYLVEKSKKHKDKVKIPILYGECGKASLSFEADAYDEKNKIVVEVEAGRAVTNYQFLKDFFEACCMDETEYLCIAVREIYGKNDNPDYKKICDFFEALYASNRIKIPLNGILIIGY